MPDERSYEERLRDAARPSGDLPVPEVGVTEVPQSVAEEGSVQDANASIRDRLQAQSKAEAEDGGGGEQAVTRTSTARKRTAKTGSDEQ